MYLHCNRFALENLLTTDEFEEFIALITKEIGEWMGTTVKCLRFDPKQTDIKIPHVVQVFQDNEFELHCDSFPPEFISVVVSLAEQPRTWVGQSIEKELQALYAMKDKNKRTAKEFNTIIKKLNKKLKEAKVHIHTYI